MFFSSSPKVVTDDVIIEEILTRGIENIFPNKDFIKSKMTKGERLTPYFGIDPTGPNLHLGHLIPILKLSKFRKIGHKVIFLVGDFTAMIGDPTDKGAARKSLSKQEILNNLKLYKEQVSKFISFSGSNPAEWKFNSTWLGKMNFEDVLQVASVITVDQMIKRDMFQKRMEEGKPIFIHEFLYPLMQGYDSIAMNIDGEIGGNDQTFNMLIGRNLMKTLKNKEKFVIATKLLTDSSGKKMGKTENNMVSLDQSPEDMFGKVMSWSDDLIVPGLEIITEISKEKINNIKDSLSSGENPKEYKKILAKEVVALCYDQNAATKAEEAFENTFTKGGIPEEVKEVSVDSRELLIDVMLKENIVSSKSEWRRLVSEGAVTNMENEDKVENPDGTVHSGVYRIGKKRFIKISVK